MVMTQWDIVGGEFVASAVKATQYPQDTVDEVAFIGRSNVGKSSLLNSLARRKGLARVSSSPGKTQTINFLFFSCQENNGERTAASYLLCSGPARVWFCPDQSEPKEPVVCFYLQVYGKFPGPEACLYPYGYPSRTHGKRY